MGTAALLLMAAAERQRRNRQRAASARRRNEEARKARNNRSSYGSSYGGSYGYSSQRGYHERPYIESVMRELEYGDDESLLEFARKFSDYCKEDAVKKGKKYAEEAEECLDFINQADERRKKVIEELEESGVRLGYDGFDQGEYHVVGLKDFSYVDAKGKRVSALERYDIDKDTVKIVNCYLFNGLYLKRSMLTNPDDTTYKDIYEKKVEENKGLREEREALIEEVQKKEKRLKRALFGKDEKEEELMKLKKRGMEIDEKLAEEEKARQRYETFKSLTPQQKSRIIEYMDLSDSMIKTSKMVEKCGSEFKKQVSKYVIGRETVEKVLDHMIEDGEMTEEKLSTIFRKFDRIAIRRNRGEYEDYPETHTRKIPINSTEFADIRKAMRGFIEHAYEEDENFVEHNLEDAVVEQEDERDEY